MCAHDREKSPEFRLVKIGCAISWGLGAPVPVLGAPCYERSAENKRTRPCFPPIRVLLSLCRARPCDGVDDQGVSGCWGPSGQIQSLVRKLWGHTESAGGRSASVNCSTNFLCSNATTPSPMALVNAPLSPANHRVLETRA